MAILIAAIAGLFTSTLGVCVFYRKAFHQRNGFFVMMFIVAAVDLLYHVCFTIFQLKLHVYHCQYNDVNNCGGWAEMWMLLMMRNLSFTLSLCSDLCTLILTVERCLALRHPYLYRRLANRFGPRSKVAVSAAVLLVTATRSHYYFEWTVVPAPPDSISNLTGYYIYEEWWLRNAWPVVILSFVSDFVLPFVLVVSMAICSGLIIGVICRQLYRHPTTYVLQTCDSLQGHKGSMVVLTLVLDALFMLNQSGYCIWTVGEIRRLYALTLLLDERDRIRYWISVYEFFAAFCYISLLMEVASHSMNIPLYIIFSKVFRRELAAFLAPVTSVFRESTQVSSSKLSVI